MMVHNPVCLGPVFLFLIFFFNYFLTPINGISNFDALVKSQFLPLRHKGTKNGLLKTFRFFFVFSVLFVAFVVKFELTTKPSISY